MFYCQCLLKQNKIQQIWFYAAKNILKNPYLQKQETVFNKSTL